MNETNYEPLNPEDNTPATKTDIERILRAIEYLAEQIGNR
jgi:hypothetical protein